MEISILLNPNELKALLADPKEIAESARANTRVRCR
jgi:hypothetical protein